MFSDFLILFSVDDISVRQTAAIFFSEAIRSSFVCTQYIFDFDFLLNFKKLPATVPSNIRVLFCNCYFFCSKRSSANLIQYLFLFFNILSTI